MTTPTIQEKIGIWYTAYEQIRDELTTKEMRTLQQTLSTVTDATGLQSAMRLAALVSANDRTAAIAAAMIAGGGGVRVIPVEPFGVDGPG